MLENIRITGDGIVVVVMDGNMAKAVILKEMVAIFSSVPLDGDPKDNYHFLNRYRKFFKAYNTHIRKVLWAFWLQMQPLRKNKENGMSEWLTIIINNCNPWNENVYIGDITVRNPAFHTVAVLDVVKCNTSNNIKITPPMIPTMLMASNSEIHRTL